MLFILGINGALIAQTTTTFNSGTGTFTVPAGVKSITVEVWGGGGKGGGVSGGGPLHAGGGGGGAYSRSVLSVTNGQQFSYSVGAGSITNGTPGGDSWFGSASTVMAKGGASVINTNNTATGGVGGAAGSGFGTVKYSGGNGFTSTGDGGGGGSSAGTGANGTNATGATGAVAPTGGGNGGNGQTGSGSGSVGSAPGGGGGGSRKTGSNSTQVGGNGASGRVSITYTVIVNGSNSDVISVSSTKLYADNTSVTTVTAEVKNASNIATTGLVLGDFSFAGAGNATVQNFQELGNGLYSFDFRNATTQTVNIEVSVLGISIGSTGNIQFILPSQANSSISPSPSTVLANNSSFSTVSITVRDNNNVVISDLIEGDFGISGQSSATVYNFVNAGGGNYSFRVRNAAAQTVNIAFTVKGTAIGTTGNIVFNTPTPNAGQSSVQVSPTSVLANGFSSATATITVKDADGVPLTDRSVGSFDFGNKGDAVFSNFTHTGNGVYTFTVTNTSVQTINASVTVSNVFIANTGNISFIDVLPNATNSDISTDVTFAVADGTDSIELTVDLRDNSNNPITNALVSEFGFTGQGSATIGNFVNVGGGIYTFDITNTVAETINISVTVRTVNLGSTGNRTFNQQTPDAGNSTVQASPTTVEADGDGTTTLTITVRDANNLAVQDLLVGDFVFSNEGNANISGFLNTGNGIYTFTATNEVEETVNIGVTVRSISLGSTGNIVFALTDPNAGNSTFTADPSLAFANGSDEIVLTVDLNDVSNNPISNLEESEFIFSGEGNATISSFTNVGSGIYTFLVNNSTVETINISLTARSVSIGNTGNLQFVAVPDITNSSVSASPTTVFADGTSASVLTTIVRDAGNNPITGLISQNFTFSGLSAASIGSFSNNGSGNYTFNVTNGTAEQISITVSVNGIEIGTSNNIEFTTPQTIQIFNSSNTFTVPDGVSRITVEAWGAGGGGAVNSAGGGGGGGSYARGTLNATPGQQFTVTVGSGGAASTAGGATTFSGNSFSFSAAGGAGANATTGGAGGGVTGSFTGTYVGTPVSFGGGAGAGGVTNGNGNGRVGGGGGGSGLFNATGGNATAGSGGIGTGNGGAGTSIDGGGVAQPGFAPGGGGGGVGQGGTAGTGAAGRIRIEYDIVSASNSSISRSPTTVVANGTATSVLTITVHDLDDDPVTNLTSGNFSFSGEGDAVINGFDNTNAASGVYTFDVSNSTIETVNIAVTVLGISIGNSGNIEFTSALPSATFSTVEADPLFVQADGNAISTLTITLKDAAQNPILNLVDTDFGFSGQSNAVIDNFQELGAGVYTFDISNSTIQNVNVTVTANTVNVGSTGTISFLNLPDPATSNITASPLSIFANGSATSVLTLDVRNNADQGITGLTAGNFQFSNQGTTTINGFQSLGNGVYTFNVSATVAQIVDISVTVTDVSIGSSGNITFLGFPSASNSSFVSSLDVLPADGTSETVLTVNVEDASGNPITDLLVGDFIFSDEGDAIIEDYSDEGGGVYTFNVRNSTSEVVEIGLTIRTVFLGTTDPIEFFAPKTLYSYQSGSWHNANTWTEDPSGTTLVNPVIPGTEDNIVILNGRTVTLTQNVTQTDQSITINNGGILDLGNFIVQELVSLSGTGVLRTRNIVSGSPNVAYFPTVSTNNFITSNGGTVVYYQQGNVTLPTSIPSYRHLTIRNTSGSNYTFTQASNIEIFGNLLLDKQSTGLLTFQLGNNTTVRDIVVTGNVTVSSGSTWTVGNFDALHTVEIGGDLVNNGSVFMQFDDTPNYQVATPTVGRSVVTFTGNVDNKIDAFGLTRFFRLIVDKGIDQTNVLTVNSTNTDNFKILGTNNQTIPGTGDNLESTKALFIRNGTLRLKSNIIIESLTSGGNDFFVNKNASLWIDGATVSSTTLANTGNTALTIIGKLQVSAGSLSTGTSAGLIIRNDAELVFEGGTTTAAQVRPSTSPGIHTASITMTGGTLTVNGNGENNATFARFSLPYIDNSFTMSGGTINVSTPNNAVGGGINLGMESGNISVTGGSWNVTAPDGTVNFSITSTAPFFNLTTQKAGTGTGDVRFETAMEVLNNLTVSSGVLQSINDSQLTLRGNMAVNSGATYTPNNNLTQFLGTSAQTFTIDGSIGSSGLYNFTVNKASNTLTLAGSTGSINVRNEYNLNSGTFEDGGKTVEVAGNVTLSGNHGGAGSLLLNPTGAVNISGNGSGTVATLELSGNASNITYSLLADLDITTGLEFIANATNDRILNIGSNNLTIGAAATISGYNADRFIQTNGLVSAAGLTKVFDDELTFDFPVGSAGKFTPATISFDVAPSTYGSITVRPADVVHPAVDQTAYALEYYWSVNQSGFDLGSALVTQSFIYDPADLGGSVVTTDLVPGKFDNAVWIPGNSGGVDENQNLITFSGMGFDTDIDGDFTAADNVNGTPFGELTIYYSRNGGGDWFDPSTWSNDSHSGTAASTIPGLGTIAIIGDNDVVTVGSNGATSAFIQVLDGSILDIGATNGHAFGTLEGVSFGELRIGSSYFPGGDFTSMFTDGTISYYRIGADYTLPTSSVNKPTISEYYNLNIEVETGAGTPFIALPNIAVTVENEFRVIGTSTDHQARINDGSSGALTVNGNSFIDSGSLRFRYGGSNSRAVVLNGDLTIASGALLGSYDANNVIHTLTITGNLLNNGTINFGTNTAQTVQIIASGSSNVSYSGSGDATFARLQINKGSSQTPKLTYTQSGSLSIASEAFLITNGTLEINRTGTLVLSNTSNAYSIPGTGALVINNSGLTVQIGNNASDTADLSLTGKLQINAGTVQIGNSANNNNNDIVYTSAGTPEITISGGTLEVNGQIRRQTASTNGSLAYRQSGSSIVRVRGRNLTTSRGMFEVVNTGSVFEMSGSSELHIFRGGTTTYQDIYILPASSTVTGGTIRLRPDAAGNQTYTFNSTAPIYNLLIENDNTNTATVTQQVNTVTISNNFTLSSGVTYNASGLNLNIGGTFTRAGTATFTAGSNTVTFNGASGVLDGDFTTNQFHNFTVASNSSLTLAAAASVRINNLLTISSNATLTEDGSGNIVDLRGNAVVNGTYSSAALSNTLGLVLNHTSAQNLSGTGVYGNVINNNSAGVSLTSNIQINGRLRLNNSGLTLGQYRLTLGTNADVSNYSATRYLLSNGVISDGGVKKLFGSGTATFEFPVGVFSKYTPVTYAITANSASGDINVTAVNVKHPSTRLVADQQLNYYWNVLSTGFSGLEVTHTYNYLQGDVTGTEANYRGGRFTGTNWTPIGGIVGAVNTTTNQITLTNVAYLNGDYSAGTEGEFGGVDVFYSRNAVCAAPTGCVWNDVNSWSADGHDGIAAISFPNGEPAVINTGHLVKTNGNNRLSESLELNGTAILDTEDDTGHNLGVVSGTGTIRLTATASNQFVFPGGNFTAFSSSSGGNVEFYGSTAGTLPTQATYNNVFMIDNATRTQPDVNWTVNGDFTITAGSISNTTFNRNITLHGDWINDSGSSAYVPGTGRLILQGSSAQSIGGSFSTNFGFIELRGGGAKSLAQPIRVQSGILFDSGNLSLNSHRLTWSSGATVTGTPSASSMIVLNSSGKIRREIASASSMTFPVGDDDGGAKYSPVTLSFNSGTFNSAYVDLDVKNAADIDCGGGNYLNRYWIYEFNGITSFSGTGVFTYNQSDVVGSESEIFTLTRGINDTQCIQGDAANTTNNTLSLSLTSTGLVVTGGDAGELLPPTVQASNIQIAAVSSAAMTIEWTNGNGTGRIVLAKEGAAVDGVPTDNITYSADAIFSGSPDEIGTGNFVVYNGSGNSFVLDGLNENTTYYLSIFEYNAIGPKISFLTTTPPTSSQLTKVLFELTFTGQHGWRMIALPLQNTALSDVFDGAGLVTQGFTGSTYPSDSPNFLWYEESYQGTDNQRWRQPANITDQIVPGRGYMYYVFGDQPSDNRYNDPFPINLTVEAFETEIISNEFDFGVTFTAAADSGWNLVGNPFAGDIDWDNINGWTKTNMTDAIYVWDPSLNSGEGDYLTWSNQTGDVALGGLISEGQSFWVKASGSNPSLIVNSNAITTGAEFFDKQAPEDSTGSIESDLRPTIQLILSKGKYEKSSFVTFQNFGSRGFDESDAFYLQPLNDSYISIFSKNTNDDNLTINSLPRRFNTPFEIPIYIGGFENGQSMDGVYELSVGDMTDMPLSWAVEMIDKATNERVIWKTNQDEKLQVLDNTLRSELSDSSATLRKNQNNPTYGFEFSYDSPVTINAPQPGDPIILRAIEGTAKSRFVLRVSPNGEFSEIPEEFVLKQNYPNPFNPTTLIEFGLPVEEHVRIDVYDILGRRVTTITNQIYMAGSHRLQFDGTALASGVYIIHMRSGSFNATRKMTLLK